MLGKINGAFKSMGMGMRRPDKVLRLHEILADNMHVHFLVKYCIAKGQCDHMIVWIELEQYRAANARILRRHKAMKIVKVYFKDKAVAQLVGAAEVAGPILAQYDKVKDNPPTTLFDAFQKVVEARIQQTLYQGFIESSHYRDLAAAQGDFSAVLSAEDFDILKFLGAGGFGMVLLVRKKSTRRLYAMKVMDKRILISRKQVFSVFREKAALAHVNHPFIVSLKYALETEHLLLLVCDYEKGGNMYSNIITHGPYTLDRARLYAAQMVLAIAQVHDMGILYRDMKPDNILLDHDGHCRLADMGAARGEAAGGEIDVDGLRENERSKTLRPSELQASIALERLEVELARSDQALAAEQDHPKPRSNRMTITGTHGYRAPEVYNRSYGKSADWWNLGLLIIEMLTGKNPFRGNNRKESEYLAKHEPVRAPSWFTKETEDIVRGFLNRDVKQRLGCTPEGVAAIMRHPFFKSVNWDELMDLNELRDKFPKWPQAEGRDMTPQALQTVDVSPETNRLDYYCDMVDYLRASKAARRNWRLSPEDQEAFKGFSFVSLEALREDLIVGRGKGFVTAGGTPRFMHMK